MKIKKIKNITSRRFFNFRLSIAENFVKTLLFFILFSVPCAAAEPINPFKPLFQNQTENVKNHENLNPLLNYDISRLRLTGILKKGDKNFALIEDDYGRGYVIVKGSKIGRRLFTVVLISENKVTLRNIFGMKREMSLNKEPF